MLKHHCHHYTRVINSRLHETAKNILSEIADSVRPNRGRHVAVEISQLYIKHKACRMQQKKGIEAKHSLQIGRFMYLVNIRLILTDSSVFLFKK